MTEVVEKPKRPTSITVICIIGFIGALISIPLLFSSFASQIGSWYPPYLALSIVIGLASMIGMWLMKKWGAYLYTGMAVVNQVILLLTGLWTIMALVIPAVVVFFALRAVSKMN
ncbi:MAG: hypothetical protein AB9891_01550 [Anaerolineaceae bacterium]